MSCKISGENMVLRVARAIHECEGSDASAWDSLDTEEFAKRLRQAQAAVGAMRKPTDAMLLSAVRLDPRCLIEKQWPAMIEAALNS